MTFDRFDVVVVPFPFTDRIVTRRRPAVVLSDRSFAERTGQSLLAMITRAGRSAWPGDAALEDLAPAGLANPCVVRLKLFTLVGALIDRRVGSLSTRDRRAVKQAVAEHLDFATVE